MVKKLPPLDARIPAWNLDDLNERNCPTCNSSNANPVYERPDDLKVRFCSKCSTFFVSPAPSGAQLERFYNDYDEKHRRAPKVGVKELAASYNNVDPLADLRIRELDSLMDFADTRVLDIGFGRAYFLYCLKKLGAVPFGLELDPQAIQFAKHLGLENVFLGDIADFASETRFDLITLLDLVEHPLEPMEVLRKSTDLLQPGGFLLIWTPNGDFSRHEESPTTFRVDLEHMQYLTPDACTFIASELKLRVTHLETIGFPALEGIDVPLSMIDAPANPLKGLVKSLPGFSAINKFRHRLFSEFQDERRGAYHLFCIMQKPF